MTLQHLVGRVESGGAAADDADVEQLAPGHRGGCGEAPRPREQQQPPPVGEEQPAGHLGSAPRGDRATWGRRWPMAEPGFHKASG